MSTSPKFASHSEAKRAGWFSRRHQTNEAHRAQHVINLDRPLVRIEEATERNEEWRKLTPQQQMASLSKRRGESKRQMAKLSKCNAK